MRITIKEAYSTAKKTLPGCLVKITVEMGRSYGFERESDTKIVWDVTARLSKDGKADGEIFSERDEIFSVALAKVAAEIAGSKAKPAEDIIVDDEIPVEENEPEEKKEEPANPAY